MLDISLILRELLLQYAPGLLSAAEAFFEQVYIVPFSSFGCLASVSPSGQLGVIPDHINPIWAADPFLTLLAEKNLITTAPPRSGAIPISGQFSGSDIIFTHPVTRQNMRLPACYAGAVMSIDNKVYQLPVNYARCSYDKQDDLWS